MRVYRFALFALCLVLSLPCLAQTAPAAPAPPGFAPIIIPFAKTTGPTSLIPIDVMINGKGPYHFMLDTGSPCIVLTTALAAEIGIKLIETPPLPAALKKYGAVKLGQLNSVEFGGESLEDGACVILPMQSGNPFQGLLGAPVFQNYVVTIDYASQTLTLSDPTTFTYQGKGDFVPLTMTEGNNHAIINATVDGIAARFALDTGFDCPLVLSGVFVKRHNLLKKSHAKQTKTFAAMPLGDEPMISMRLPALTLGKNVFRDVLTLLQAPDAATDIPADGLIGGEILQRFTVTFDYTNKRAWFEPNKNFAAPDASDRAGFVAHYENSTYLVTSIDAHSPAAKVKLKAGNRILKINGVDTAKIDLLQFNGFFCQPAGTVLHLTVRSAKKTREVTLILKEYYQAPGQVVKAKDGNGKNEPK